MNDFQYFPSIRWQPILLPLLFLLNSLFSGCTTSKIVTITTPEVQVKAAKVLVLPPELLYVSIENDEKLEPSAYQAEQVRSFFIKRFFKW